MDEGFITDPGEPDFHPAWAHYENMRLGRTPSTPDTLEAARKEAEKEGHGQFKKRPLP